MSKPELLLPSKVYMGVCNCSMFCYTLLYVHSSIAIILMGKRELVALLNLSSWCLVMVERLFLVMPWGCLRFVNVVFPDHTYLLFINYCLREIISFTKNDIRDWGQSNTKPAFNVMSLSNLRVASFELEITPSRLASCNI